MSQQMPPEDSSGKDAGEYLVLLVEETDRARIKFLDRYIAEKLIPCHKKGAWLGKGPSIKYFVPESYYLGLCAALSIEPDPVIAGRAGGSGLEPDAGDEPEENARMPVSRWLPLLIIVGGAILALIIALIAGALS